MLCNVFFVVITIYPAIIVRMEDDGHVPINENINIIAQYADQVFDNRDYLTLNKIAEDCYGMLDSSEYTDLEKAILAYHGATSFGNYISIVHNGAMKSFTAGHGHTVHTAAPPVLRAPRRICRPSAWDSRGENTAA